MDDFISKICYFQSNISTIKYLNTSRKLMLPHSTNFGLFHSLLKQLWPSQEFCPYHRSSVSKDGRMRNSLHVTSVKVYIYISLFWRCYCKCGVFGRQFFFFLFFFFPKKHLLLSITYFDITLGVG